MDQHVLRLGQQAFVQRHRVPVKFTAGPFRQFAELQPNVPQLRVVCEQFRVVDVVGQGAAPRVVLGGVGPLQRVHIGFKLKSKFRCCQFIVQALLLRRVPGDLRPVVCADHIRLFLCDIAEQILSGCLQVLHGPASGSGPPEIPRRVVLHGAVVDLEPPQPVRPAEPSGFLPDLLGILAGALHFFRPGQGLPVRPIGVPPGKTVPLLRWSSCRRRLLPPSCAALIHHVPHGLGILRGTGGEGVFSRIGVREDFLQDVPHGCVDLRIRGVFRYVDYAAQFLDVGFHDPQELFLRKPAGDLLPDGFHQSGVLRRLDMELLVVSDLVDGPPHVVRLDVYPVSLDGSVYADRPRRRGHLQQAGEVCHGVSRLGEPLGRLLHGLVVCLLRHRLHRPCLRPIGEAQVPAAYRGDL